MIWSVVLYGSETWTMRKKDIKILKVFEMWIWCRMERISWMEHRTNEEILKMVDEKRSLIGIIRSHQSKCHVEIRRRIAMGKDAFYKRKELLRGKLNKNLKKRIIKSMIWSVVLYGSETWTMRKEDIKRLEVFEMWIWHRMERISWMEHRTNEEILKMVDEKRSP